MSGPVGFGRRVLVHALTMRVVAYRDGDVERFKIPQAADLPFGFPTRVDAVWPGDPVELDWDLPKGPRFSLEPSLNGRPAVRYRRHHLDHPVEGIVIGTGWRYEGMIDTSTLAGPKRSIGLYEVALQPRSTKALVVLVHPQDVELVVAQGRGAPAPTRTGTGRLGGGV